ncbi:hypothetical protein DPEC_G00336970 [Dallia pectoralis]|uniref:Uncharacterized protein n=1 Tax=Dallia pectoralis TaxID=75939 RepID=A0ACC2F7D5_DALPE|nr:hypothetical protein DPEC_G00336970 [Dallia pectoralis]
MIGTRRRRSIDALEIDQRVTTNAFSFPRTFPPRRHASGRRWTEFSALYSSHISTGRKSQPGATLTRDGFLSFPSRRISEMPSSCVMGSSARWACPEGPGLSQLRLTINAWAESAQVRPVLLSGGIRCKARPHTRPSVSRVTACSGQLFLQWNQKEIEYVSMGST